TTAYADAQATAAVSGKQNTLTNSAGLAAALSDETGTGLAVFATSPTLVTPNLGTPSTLVGTNITGTAAGLTAGTVTTNANLTGEVTSTGNATTVTNAAVIGKLLTGYISGAGTVAATDNILQAIQKLNGNDGLKANLASPTFTGTPTLPTGTIAVTQAANNNSTAVATTAYADAAALAAMPAGAAAGNTPYWSGTAWVANNSNIWNEGGNVGIGMNPVGAQKLQVNGKVKSNGINETSDERWKMDIKTIENALPKVLAMRGVNYNWRTEEFPDKNFNNGLQLGLIAQEVEKVIPEVVDTDEKGFKSVEYSKLVALLLEAIKEQQKQIAKQEADIAALKSDNKRIDNMEEELAQFKALLQNMIKNNVSAQNETKK
ncbi:MAG: tail fiber domain-containing protein, partial [Daejeonella sp.]|uniref:tail fiber domain-containing protein n=1 Tax=Daejeonella sp. TaxID=2805397 RepID=UPI0027325A1A